MIGKRMTPQAREDIAEIVEAHNVGGQHLANRTYAAIVQARKLTCVEAAMLSGYALDKIDKETA